MIQSLMRLDDPPAGCRQHFRAVIDGTNVFIWQQDLIRGGFWLCSCRKTTACNHLKQFLDSGVPEASEAMVKDLFNQAVVKATIDAMWEDFDAGVQAGLPTPVCQKFPDQLPKRLVLLD